ncbi:MAG: hypothetical protein K2W95_28740 [Candidatus Obscuribacterales bacterium]|nr:hypothetical protein [Candidatus Obscuribacterales bacterium]
MRSALTQLTELKCDSHAAIVHACAAFQLRTRGWRGVEEMVEVVQLHIRCPRLAEATRLVSGYMGGNYHVVEEVFSAASPDDRLELRGYFLVKAALEYLSGRLSGPAAGSCDKMTAYIHIWQESPRWMSERTA